MVNSLLPWLENNLLYYSAKQYTTHFDEHHKFSTLSEKLKFELPDKMRLAVYMVICCCVFTTILPLVKGATAELNNSSLKKRFKTWQQGRLKRDLCDSLANEQYSDVPVAPQQDENTKLASSPSSFGLHIRQGRSPSTKSSGCVLVTCAYQDLLHRLHQFTNKQKEVNAPGHKIGSNGYGRRRRSLLDVVLQTGRQRRSPEAAPAAEIEDRRSSMQCP